MTPPLPPVARAIILRQHGPSSTLCIEDHDPGLPSAGEVLIRHTAIGVNFHDTYVRSGQYQTLPLPGIPGIEAAGVVLELGEEVAGLTVGDRIAYVTSTYGAYATHRTLGASLAVRLPDDIADDVAASMMVRGMTIEMLVGRVHNLRANETILVQAAAGGVGRLLVHYAAKLGARVIGTAGSEEKARIATEAGCDAVIQYRHEDVAEQVMDLTSGRGVDVAYDSVGRDTFDGSITSLKACGHLVMLGQSSGAVDPVPLSVLGAKSLTLSRPILFHYIDSRESLDAMASNLFGAIRDGRLPPLPTRAFPLADVATAHDLLESRETDRAIILIP